MIHAIGLRKILGDRPVLDGVDLHLQAGERVALIGANGAGKTTFLRCLLGEYVFSGSLTVAGWHPLQHRLEMLHQVGFVPQSAPPLPMRTQELIAAAARLAGISTTSIEEKADALGFNLARHRHQVFALLSGGMKQKLLIAIALGRAPPVLILDEPAANLDPEGRRIFFHLLLDLSQKSLILLSSHRIDEISGLVTRLVEMDHGRVVVDRPIVPGS